MTKYKVDITGVNTQELKVLTNEEMTELFKKYQQGDLKAKEELINGNLKLVLSILRKFNNQKFNMDDLFQIGCVGLIKAVDNFDLSHQVMFSTYAVPLILGEVKRYIRDNTSLRVSRSLKDLAYRILKFKEEYLATHNSEPDNATIAKALDTEEYMIANALCSLKEPVSIYEPIYNDGGDTIYLLDQIADKKAIQKDQDLHILLHKSLEKIKKRERSVLIDRFIIGKTQTEIAEMLGISQAQVSRIEKNALANLKKMIN